MPPVLLVLLALLTFAIFLAAPILPVQQKQGMGEASSGKLPQSKNSAAAMTPHTSRDQAK
jgi:hypothetical protein